MAMTHYQDFISNSFLQFSFVVNDNITFSLHGEIWKHLLHRKCVN